MSGIYREVKQDGSGDYTDLITAINAMLSEGLAASGSIDEYYLTVDDNLYTGSFSIDIPYSGRFFINGDNTQFEPTAQCYVTGFQSIPNSPNLTISNFNIFSTNVTDYIFLVESGVGFKLDNVDMFRTQRGIYSDESFVYLNNVRSMGIGTDPFLIGYLSELKVENTHIVNYATGISGYISHIENSSFCDNYFSIISSNDLKMNNVLVKATEHGVIINSGHFTSSKNTIYAPKPILINNSSTFEIDGTIGYGSAAGVTGIGSGNITDSVLYPSTRDLTISGDVTNVSNDEPLFNDISDNDFRLKFKQTTGSKFIEWQETPFPQDIELQVEPLQLLIYDDVGAIPREDFFKFIYKQDDSLLFSDYGKEVEFAKALSKYNQLAYAFITKLTFSSEDIVVDRSFPYDSSIPKYPWEWDYKKFYTTKIEDSDFIVPRSVVSLVDIFDIRLSGYSSNILFDGINKDSIKVYNKTDYKGISYDYDLSQVSQSVLWAIEGKNQLLIKQDAFTGEEIEKFPLLCPDRSIQPFIRPSGLIYDNPHGDKYTFVVDPRISTNLKVDRLDGLSERGDFRWISTDIDPQKEVRGIFAYKNKLYVTLTENPDGNSIGKILMYDNSLNYDHYISNYTNINSTEPKSFILDENNSSPTDLTIYENGELRVLDYTSPYIYSYRFAYDYALIQSSYDNEARILLRENYNDVSL